MVVTNLQRAQDPLSVVCLYDHHHGMTESIKGTQKVAARVDEIKRWVKKGGGGGGVGVGGNC